MKKQIIKAISLIAVLALSISFALPLGDISVKAAEKKVKLNKKKITLTTGDWKKLKLKNGDFAIDDIEWSTSDKAVAKVSRKGWVVALVKGECTIKAKVKATGKTYKCKVTVNAPDISKRVIDPEKPIIALTFDDGPGPNTSGLLETLKTYGATATFFMCYSNGSGFRVYSDVVREVYNAGCEVANHTQNHPQLTKCSASKIDDEVNGNADKLAELVGKGQRFLLRPPYGAFNDTVKQIANVPLIIWSVDSLDWKYKTQSNCTELIMKEVKAQAKDGGIILMHDIHKTSCEAVKTVLPWLIQQGYQVCSVSEMFEARGVELENGVSYTKCITAAEYKANK